MNPTFKRLAAPVAALLLTACGGGGSDDVASMPPAASGGVPASASRSVPEMIAWLAALAGADSDAKEPLAADNFAPPAPNDADSSELS